MRISALTKCYCALKNAVSALTIRVIALEGQADSDNQTLTNNDVGGVTTGITISGGNTIPINHPAPVTPVLNTTTETIFPEKFMGRSSTGTNVAFVRNATMTRTAVGQWTVTFAAAHADGANYTIETQAEEQSANRDTPDITVVQGTQSPTGFQVQITTGDNGTAADGYVDTPWSFGVEERIDVITAVSVA